VADKTDTERRTDHLSGVPGMYGNPGETGTQAFQRQHAAATKDKETMGEIGRPTSSLDTMPSAEPTAAATEAGELKGSLPDDFPGVEKLRAADITSYGKLRPIAERGELTSVEGIGEATAKKINEALGVVETPA
jgi:DNA uptake protein ComE-like DNA-binding protein